MTSPSSSESDHAQGAAAAALGRVDFVDFLNQPSPVGFTAGVAGLVVSGGYSIPAHSLPPIRSQGELRSGQLSPPGDASCRGLMISEPHINPFLAQ